jgi:hypothetical protein
MRAAYAISSAMFDLSASMWREAVDAIGQLHAELTRRLESGGPDAPSIFVLINGIQRFRALRRAENPRRAVLAGSRIAASVVLAAETPGDSNAWPYSNRLRGERAKDAAHAAVRAGAEPRPIDDGAIPDRRECRRGWAALLPGKANGPSDATLQIRCRYGRFSNMRGLSVERVIPLGAGAWHGGSGPTRGGTGLIVLVALVQLLGFAIPVVIATTIGPEHATGFAYEFQWTYDTFSLHAPGPLEWALYLPATGIAALIAVFLPTQYLRPLALIVIGAALLVVLYRYPEVHARLLARLPLFGWGADKTSALKGVTLLALAIGGGMAATNAPRGLVVGATVGAALPAIVYLGVPLHSEFPGGFAWKSSFAELMSTQPLETSWSEVAAYYLLLAAFGIDLLAIGLAALICLISFRDDGFLAGRWVGWCVAVSPMTSVLVIVARAMRPLDDLTYAIERFLCEVAVNLKMFLATLSIVLLLPVAVIDLIGRHFHWRV